MKNTFYRIFGPEYTMIMDDNTLTKVLKVENIDDAIHRLEKEGYVVEKI